MIAMNSPIYCEILYINLAWGDCITVDSIRLSLSIELEGSLCFIKPKECFSSRNFVESKLPCEALARKSTPQSDSFDSFDSTGAWTQRIFEPKKHGSFGFKLMPLSMFRFLIFHPFWRMSAFFFCPLDLNTSFFGGCFRVF